MGATKKQQYSNRQLAYARTAKAIGHPARIAIIEHLAEEGTTNNSACMSVTQLSDATVCQHLNELLGAGLINETFLGNRHVYYLTPEARTHVIRLKQVILPGTRKKGIAKKRIP